MRPAEDRLPKIVILLGVVMLALGAAAVAWTAR